jgi:parallel beta-helix repeat protein
MRTRSWIRQLFTRPVRRAVRKAPYRVRPALEALEDRCVPSTIVVNNPTDIPVAGEIDLRQAIVQANTNGGNETITFDKTVFQTPQTITLNGTQLELSDTTGTETITGPAVGVTVSGDGLSRVFQVDGGVTASASELTIEDGNAGSSNGGGITNFGTLTLKSCTVSGNTTSGYGGGIYNAGILTVEGTTVSSNSCGVTGGGIMTFVGSSGLTLVTDSSILDNSAAYGAGIGGSTTVIDCSIDDNSASGNGGGMVGGGISVLDSIISGNTAPQGAGIDSAGIALTGCTVSDNSASGDGGGLWSAPGSTNAMTDCTVSGNSAAVGGGIFNNGTLNVVHSNILQNQATSAGGGISTTGGNATITDSVIDANQVNSSATALGGGIDCENSTLALTGCTVSGNQVNGATALGGGVYALNSTEDVENSTVKVNKANGTVLGEGGGIYSFDSLLILRASTVKGNNATTAFNNIFNGP